MAVIGVDHHIGGNIVKTDGLIITSRQQLGWSVEIHAMRSTTHKPNTKKVCTRSGVELVVTSCYFPHQTTWYFPSHLRQQVIFHHGGNCLEGENTNHQQTRIGNIEETRETLDLLTRFTRIKDDTTHQQPTTTDTWFLTIQRSDEEQWERNKYDSQVHSTPWQTNYQKYQFHLRYWTEGSPIGI